VSIGLLDVNALIALLWEEHPFHKCCADWFAKSGKEGWATCPMTESGCVKILSTPAFTANPPSVVSALRILQTAAESSGNHHFWNDDLPLSALRLRWSSGLGHKQVTDAYLLSLAIHHKGSLVTFDARMEMLAGLGNVANDSLVVLRRKRSELVQTASVRMAYAP
jgi:toxin-antitoxin system PIN domain toxin